MDWNIPTGPFNTIVIDPPWPITKTGLRKTNPNQGLTLDYRTISIDDIKSIPIRNIASDDSVIFLWVTNGRCDDKPIMHYAIDMLGFWDFTWYTLLTWNKRRGVCPFGPIQITTEHVIVAYRGRFQCPRECMGKMQSIFTETNRNHSRKPDVFYASIKKFTVEPRLDLFAREKRDGFIGWGDQYNG